MKSNELSYYTVYVRIQPHFRPWFYHKIVNTFRRSYNLQEFSGYLRVNNSESSGLRRKFTSQKVTKATKKILDAPLIHYYSHFPLPVAPYPRLQNGVQRHRCETHAREQGRARGPQDQGGSDRILGGVHYAWNVLRLWEERTHAI